MIIYRFVNLWAVLYVVWLALTFPFSGQQIIAGAVVSFITALISIKFIKGKVDLLNPKRIGGFLWYLPVFTWALIKANVEIAITVLHPFMPIRPGIVAVKTGLKRDISKALLANSITLTPGTLTVDVEDDTMHIHCVKVPTSETEISRLAKPFEDHIRRISE